MKDTSKSDFALGKEIHKLLVEEGIETPMVRSTLNLSEANYSLIEGHIQAIMVALGLDMTDDSLVETPRRIAKMYLNEVFWGLNYMYFPKITTIENKMQYSNMLVERHIKVNSLCLPGWQMVNSVGKPLRAREVKVGTKLWTLNNGVPVQTTVEKVTTHITEKLVKVTLANGTSITLTPDHPLKTKTKWVEAGDSLGEFVEYVNPRTLCKESFSFNVGRELGYFLAVVAAECSIQDDRRICLETENEEVADDFIYAIERVFGKRPNKENILKPSSFTGKKIKQFRVRIVSSQIAKRTLKMLGIPFNTIGCGSKTFKFHLPEICKYNYAVWRGFLDGYIATDGTHYAGKDQEYKRIISSNENFVKELCEFLQKRIPKGRIGTSSKHPCYMVNITNGEHGHEWFSKHGFPQEEFTLDLGESSFVEVVSVEEICKPTKVYSFKCAEYPTFCVRGILTHNCEHHFMPFVGEAFVAYIPKTKVIGLSKINRLVEFFSRRPQVQERLTEQVFFALSYVLETDNVAVVIKADHTCVRVRGVEDTNADTVTSRLGGCFLENFNLRNELFNILHID